MTEHGEVRISADMTLEKFREGLEPLMPIPEARPFTCTGSPLECRLFIVGLYPATQLEQDFFGRYWSDDRGFLRDDFEADYSHKRKKAGTRPRIEAFVKGACPVRCLETNIYAVPKETACGLESKNTKIIEYLIETIQPDGIFVHINKPKEFFQELSGCKPGDEPKLVKKKFRKPTWLLGAPRPLQYISIDDARTAGTKMKDCVEGQCS